MNVRYPIPEWFTSLPYNHQGDFASFALLLEHGGVYLDSDTLLVNSLDGFCEYTQWYEFVAFSHVGTDSCGVGHHHGAMASRPNAALLRMYYVNIIRFYEDVHGCMGASCATQPRNWLDTLNYAFDGDAAHDLRTPHRAQTFSQLVEAEPCSVMRLPYDDFEWSAITGMRRPDDVGADAHRSNFGCLLAAKWNVSQSTADPAWGAGALAQQILLRIVQNATEPTGTAQFPPGYISGQTHNNARQLVLLHMSPLKRCGGNAAHNRKRVEQDLWRVVNATPLVAGNGSLKRTGSNAIAFESYGPRDFEVVHIALNRGLSGQYYIKQT
eukprot:COSAG05_NODE_163_length_15471_cov_29.575072_9_plen_325_part_00